MTAIEEVGHYRGVAIQLAAWDGARADVDLSAVCMFTAELELSEPRGGLAHLDTALGGALVQLRRERILGAAGRILLIEQPPTTISARELLVVGMGPADGWTPADTADAVERTFTTAVLRRCGSVAFAPSLLDSGLNPPVTADIPDLMVNALASALDRCSRLADLGLSGDQTLRNWTFDVGESRFDEAANRFRAALVAVRPPNQLAPR